MEIPKNIELIETQSSVAWFDQDGILCSISKPYQATLEETKQSVENFQKITKGKRVACLIDITHSKPSSKEVRDYVAVEMPKLVTAIAMISNSALGRMVANLFFGLKPPPYPTKMFASEEEAKAWLKQYINK